jgi:protein tyrosine phosphatase
MVTNEVEMGKMKCHRYWPDPTSSPPAPVQQYGDIVVEHVRAVPHLHFIVREFLLSLNGETRRLKHFAYTSWPDHGVPLTTTELLGFRNAVKVGRASFFCVFFCCWWTVVLCMTACSQHRCSQEAQGSTTAPLLIHCSAGVGRTGTYIAIDHIVEQCLNLGGTIDIDTVVRTMRMARNYMVN